MKIDWRIISEGKDISHRFSTVESITVKDETDVEADTCEICVDDSEQSFEIPRNTASFNVLIGSSPDGLVDLGRYFINHVSTKGSPRLMTIFGVAKPFNQSFLQAKERSWPEATLFDIASKIAAEQGLKPAIDKALASINVGQIDQTQSDMHLLTKLAKRFDATFKPQAGHLVFVRKGSAAHGVLPQVNITDSFLDDWEHSTHPSAKYSGVSAHYVNDKGEQVKVTAGSPQNVFEIKYTQKSEQAAWQIAENKLREFHRGIDTLRFGITISKRLNPAVLLAGQVINVKGLRKGVDGNWLIRSLTHKLSPSSSYQCKVECESLVL